MIEAHDTTMLTIVQEYNGLAIRLEVHSGNSTPEGELLREFIRQHKDSVLVLIPTGAYHGGTINPGTHIDWFVIRRRQAPPPLWRRIVGFLRGAYR